MVFITESAFKISDRLRTLLAEFDCGGTLYTYEKLV